MEGVVFMCLEHWIKDEFSSSVPLHPKKKSNSRFESRHMCPDSNPGFDSFWDRVVELKVAMCTI